jgi:hypothetical protein
MRLALVWTKKMHEHAGECLRTYIRATPATVQAHDAAKWLMSTLAYHEEQNRRLQLDVDRHQRRPR